MLTEKDQGNGIDGLCDLMGGRVFKRALGCLRLTGGGPSSVGKDRTRLRHDRRVVGLNYKFTIMVVNS